MMGREWYTMTPTWQWYLSSSHDAAAAGLDMDMLQDEYTGAWCCLANQDHAMTNQEARSKTANGSAKFVLD
jgi:hypothetical protein